MDGHEEPKTLLFTMRELQDDTANIITVINVQDKPAVITRMGRFVAIIYPLAYKNVESNVLGKLLDENGELR
jgi:hypothetical protein